ncbi:hypothetical protein PI126_g13684 [Phytophthora idaei]|nr:hypothetical protein PI126_g13684 [Phytophthora idaei]
MEAFVAGGVTDPYEFYQYVHVSETIKSGKARVCIVGGYDDFGEESAFEFAQMKATSDSVKETSMGREPKEMCRPCSSTLDGFMESHGAGIQLLMDGQLALDMALPIYGIMALANTATDKNGRSVPAPGQGILTTAREAVAQPSPLLDVEYRRRQFDDELESIEKWFAREKTLVDGDDSRLKLLGEIKERKLKAAQAIFHATGTKANDKNENEVAHKQMAHLGRSPGNPLPVICQKSITGHPKGAAAAWQLNGLLQVLNTGLIPGNRQLDNTWETLRKYNHLVHANRSLQTDGIKVVLLKSFGFGQQYAARREKRLAKMNTHAQSVITGKKPHIQVKNEAPYSSAQESSVYLDPTARAQYDAVSQTWRFGASERRHRVKRVKKTKTVAKAASSTKALETDTSSSLLTAMNHAASELGLASQNMSIGVDVQPVATFENLNGREDFIRRNFTDREISYCYSAAHPAASFAARWAVKEAVIKAISTTEATPWQRAEASRRDIEVVMTASGAPSVLLSGDPLQVFDRLELAKLSVSISHEFRLQCKDFSAMLEKAKSVPATANIETKWQYELNS